MTFYRHSKTGNEYEGLGKALPIDTVENFEPIDYWFMIATHSETMKYVKVFYNDDHTQYFAEGNEELMVYVDKFGKAWVRPYEMFFELVEIDGVKKPRFQEIDFTEVEMKAEDFNERG